ncbi:zinc finger protein 14-like [Anneissia japonica]|uniref:zinc finger protein 14-like n=1 Tax=Anneissia japonica TaxID=1529436 RepID=UPI001425B279|nr:zinc finger protein 14-like [Anneissia japonica]
MASAMTQPMILPNSVSSSDWLAAETNIDIILIQFYRCKLCQNQFSSLNRPVIVAHMMQAHEREWNAACHNVKELKRKETLKNADDITESKKSETIKKRLPDDTNNMKSISPLTRHYTKQTQGDSVVPHANRTRKPWKKPANFKPENACRNQKLILDSETLMKLNNSSSEKSSFNGNLSYSLLGSIESSKFDLLNTSQSDTTSVDVNVDESSEKHSIMSEGQSSLLPPSRSESPSNKSEGVTCKQCGYICGSWIEHWTHSHEHLPIAEKVRYPCQACKLNFGSERTLQQHHKSNPECKVSQTAGGRRTLKCSLCNFQSHSNHSLKIHVGAQHKKNTNDLKIVYCLVCNARFNSKRSLRRHRQNGKCGRTERGRPKGINCKIKPRPPSIPKVIVCDLCNRTFDKNYRYNEHYATHFDERKQQCNECGKAFKTKRGLRRHAIIHQGMKFSCDLCDFQTFWRASIKRHKKMKHFSEDLPYLICSMCTYKSKDPNAIRTHERYIHREKKEYICETCGKLFKLSTALKYHQQTHNDKRQYPCDKCSYVGRTRFSLYSHKSEHITKEQMEFKCDQCSWIGRRQSELKRHYRKHSDNKRYYCHHCGLGYKHKHGLTRHLKEKHFGTSFTPVEMPEPDESNIYTDDIIVAQVFEV